MYNLFITGAIFISCLFSIQAFAQTHTPAHWNDMARFLAGLPLEASSQFEQLTRSKNYLHHKMKMNEYWERVEKGNIAQIIPWRARYIEPHFNRGTVLYPLSGGDFINMYTFYPGARRYVMISREPEGTIPDLFSLSDSQLASGLQSIRSCIWSIASVNYFVTKAMRAEMKNRYIGGTLPVYLIYASRLGLTITNIERVGISKEGMLFTINNGGTIKGETPVISGNRISFIQPGSNTPGELIYLSMYITPKSMDAETPEGKFLSSLSRINVIIKSAVYLLHRPAYEPFVRALLQRTSMLIEDDSGIPFRYLNPDVFSIKLFGAFDTPVRLKEIPNPPKQPDLADAMKENTTPLPFSFGYGVLRKDRQSNLILAIRQR